MTEVRTNNIHSESEFVEAYADRKPESYAPVLAQVVRRGKPGTSLDLGSGLGLFVEFCEKWGLDVIGLEGSPYAVQQSIKRVPGMKCLRHDLGDPFPFLDQSISNVVLNQVVEHVDQSRFKRLIAECYRVLEVEGVIFIYSPSKKNIVEKSEPTHINMMLPSDLRVMLERTGFRVLEEPNSGFWFMPSGPRLMNGLADVLMRIFPHDWLSATTNVIACKR